MRPACVKNRMAVWDNVPTTRRRKSDWQSLAELGQEAQAVASGSADVQALQACPAVQTGSACEDHDGEAGRNACCDREDLQAEEGEAKVTDSPSQRSRNCCNTGDRRTFPVRHGNIIPQPKRPGHPALPSWWERWSSPLTYRLRDVTFYVHARLTLTHKQPKPPTDEGGTRLRTVAETQPITATYFHDDVQRMAGDE